MSEVRLLGKCGQGDKQAEELRAATPNVSEYSGFSLEVATPTEERLSLLIDHLKMKE